MKEIIETIFEQNSLDRLVYGLSPLVTYLDANDIDCSPLFEVSGIQAQTLGIPGMMMNFSQEQKFTEKAIELMKDPELALKIGSRFSLNSYGVLGLTIMSSKNLAEGLKTITDLHCLTWSHLCWRLSVNDGHTILEGMAIEPLGSCMRYMIERDFVATLTACQEMLGQSIQLKEAHFKYSKPDYACEYDEIFRCPIHFNSSNNQLIFNEEWLYKPLPKSNPAVHQVSYSMCQKQVQEIYDKHSYAKFIENIIVDQDGNFFSLNQLTNKLHVSTRTLRRKLAQEGTSFQEILSNLRVKIAIDMLINSKASIEKIAEKLCYSDAASFCNAFKRWTGQSPSMYRKSN